MTAPIDFYFDFSSPYGFLALEKIEGLAAKHSRTLDWHPAARAAIDDPAIKAALKRENEQGIARGVFGSPFVIVDGESFWGFDRFDQVDRWLATGGW